MTNQSPNQEKLIKKYSDVFTALVESGEAAVNAQLDKYETGGHIAPVTEPSDWISNMVIVSRPDKLGICLDPKFLNKALRCSHYIMPTLEDVLYKLPKARVFTLVDAKDAFLQAEH